MEEGKKRILVADDNPGNCRSTKMLLQDKGFEVVDVLDGETAVKEIPKTIHGSIR